MDSGGNTRPRPQPDWYERSPDKLITQLRRSAGTSDVPPATVMLLPYKVSSAIRVACGMACSAAPSTAAIAASPFTSSVAAAVAAATAAAVVVAVVAVLSVSASCC